MNANITLITQTAYERLAKVVSYQAYKNCVHKHKRIMACSKNKECYMEGILNFYFKELAKLN